MSTLIDASTNAQPSRGGQWIAAVCAVIAAAVGWWIAPAPWPAGDGALVVRIGDRVALRAPVVVGDSAVVDGAGDGVRLEVRGGVKTDAPLEAAVTFASGGEIAMGDVSLTLELADGRRAVIPVVLATRDGTTFIARRRPPVGAAVMFALLGLVIVLWVTEAVPLFATALLVPVVIVAAGLGPPAAALQPFFHPLIALFFGTFLIAEAIHRVELDRRVATHLVAAFGRSPVALFAALMGAAAVFSMWMTNTGTTILLVPIALAITAPLHNAAYSKVLVLGIAYAATTGGIGSIVGTPPNAIAVEGIANFTGREIGFAEWFAFGLPVVIVLVPIIGVFLWWRRGVRVDRDRFGEVRRAAAEQRASLAPMSGRAWIVTAVFAAVVALWMTSELHGVHAGIVAIGGAVVLVVARQVRESDLARISWNALITFGGGIALGVYMERSGAADWMASSLGTLSGLPGILSIGAVALFTVAITAFASNTASAAMLIPVAMPLAGVLGIDPVTLAVVVGIAASLDYAMVIGTPPTMIAYSTRLFTTREIFRAGIALDLIGVVVLVTVVRWIWQLLGVA